MKLKKLIVTAVAITTLSYAGIGQVSAEKEEFSPTIQITKNLTTILPNNYKNVSPLKNAISDSKK